MHKLEIIPIQRYYIIGHGYILFSGADVVLHFLTHYVELFMRV